jgi:hypothetical protein
MSEELFARSACIFFASSAVKLTLNGRSFLGVHPFSATNRNEPQLLNPQKKTIWFNNHEHLNEQIR